MSNRLANETSPYLLQHAENPVDWYPWGEEALRPCQGRAEADPRLDRLRRVPLVPRDGARVLRGPRGRGADERALRLHQGRPRGAPGRRRDLHGRRPGHDGPGRLAAQRLPHARRRPLLRRHLLPARAAPRHAVVAAGGRRRRERLRRAARGDRGGGPADAPAARRRGEPAARRGRARPGGARRGRRRAAARLRPGARRLHAERPEVPRRLLDRVPAAPRGAPDGAPHAARDGLGRHVRPGRRRVRALLGRRAVDHPALREDALRQRAARPRVPARLPGLGRAVLRARVHRDARLGAARPAPGGGRLRVGARRRLRRASRGSSTSGRPTRCGRCWARTRTPPSRRSGSTARRTSRAGGRRCAPRATPRDCPSSSGGCARRASSASGRRSTTSA